MWLLTTSIISFLVFATFKDGLCVNIVTEANNDLAIRMYKRLSQDPGNVFFSPFSITVAMAMLLRGTAGETSSQIMQVLGFKPTCDPNNIHESLKSILNDLTEEKGTSIFAVANVMISEKQFPLIEAYKRDLRRIYDAVIIEADLMREKSETIEVLNEWVKTLTKNRVSKIIDDLDPSTVLILTNTVYFKSLWFYEFNPEYTRLWSFLNYGLRSYSKDVPMMFAKNDFLCMENEDLKAIELPYQGKDMSLIVVMNKDITGLSALERHLRPDFIKSLRKRMFAKRIEVSFPKFQLEFSRNFKEIFMDFGLHKIFSFDGNFQNMTRTFLGFRVSEIVHKTILDINEEGSQAAAVTSALIQKRCLDTIPEFLVDRPFFFVIYNSRLDIILFIGKVDEL